MMQKIITNRRKSPGGGESYDVLCVGRHQRKSALTPADWEQIELTKREFERLQRDGA